MRKSTIMMAAAGLALSVSSAAFAQGTDFASATVLNIGTNNPQFLSGAVEAGTAPTFAETLVYGNYENNFVSGAINSFGPIAMTAGAAFRAETNAGAAGGALDTRMRARTSDGTILDDDDDDGPGAFSQVVGNVPGDGVMNFDVTFWQDNGYTGAHTANGVFDIEVYELQEIDPGTPGVTGQWWAFTGLTPGGQFLGYTSNGSGLTDTVMAAFASDGSALGSDDDGGAGLYSRLTGTVPADGIVYVAVSGYHGGFNQPIQATQGYYTSGGTANGSFGLFFVPAPGSFALLGLGGLAMARRRR
jgi:hypothetical protein